MYNGGRDPPPAVRPAHSRLASGRTCRPHPSGRCCCRRCPTSLSPRPDLYRSGYFKIHTVVFFITDKIQSISSYLKRRACYPMNTGCKNERFLCHIPSYCHPLTIFVLSDGALPVTVLGAPLPIGSPHHTLSFGQVLLILQSYEKKFYLIKRLR